MLSVEPKVTTALVLEQERKEMEKNALVADEDQSVKIPLSSIGHIIDFEGNSLSEDTIQPCDTTIDLFEDLDDT